MTRSDGEVSITTGAGSAGLIKTDASVAAALSVATQRSDAVPTGTFILADGHWLFLTREGEVALAPATASGLKCATKFKALEGKCYATPTLASGHLFVRSNTGEVAAFDLR